MKAPELTAEQRRLVEEHAPLVARLTDRFAARYRGLIERQEVAQVAWYGVVMAAVGFRPSLGDFGSYAWATATGHLQHAARWAARQRLFEAAAPFFANHIRESDLLDGDDAARAELARIARRAAVSMLLGFGAARVADLQGRPTPDGELVEGWVDVHRAVTALAPAERLLVERLYFNGEQLAELPGELGVGYHALRRRHLAALDHLRDMLEGTG